MLSFSALFSLFALLPVALGVPAASSCPSPGSSACLAGTGAFVCCRTYVSDTGVLSPVIMPGGICSDGMWPPPFLGFRPWEDTNQMNILIQALKKILLP